MSTPADQLVFGAQVPQTPGTEYTALTFIIQQMLNRMQTATLVRVVSCTNSGGVSPVGLVSVTPLVNQMTGNRQAVPHGVINNVPYLRMQGGANAVILDPQAGDIGIAVFGSRDLSGVKAAKGQANPGSLRQYDWADALYLGGVLNGAPQQYVQFSAAGVSIVAAQVTIQSTAGNTTIDGVPFLPHTHSGVQTGGGDTGPVVP